MKTLQSLSVNKEKNTSLEIINMIQEIMIYLISKLWVYIFTCRLKLARARVLPDDVYIFQNK